jgi:hypothetical protein
MFKFLLYVGFIFLLIYWFLILPFKPSLDKDKQSARKRTRNGNLNVDNIPEGNQKNPSKGYDGGDYVDYEEIK